MAFARNFLRHLVTWLAWALVASYFTGCAPPPEPESDPFVDEWLERAEVSKGHSPKATERETVEIDRTDKELDRVEEPKPERPLPRDKVTLRLHDAPVRTVLRAMARAAGQNILINETVTGTMSVNIEEVPWDDAFKGILDSQGLTYTRQGDIIRVKSMQDLQHELDMSGLQQELTRRKMESEGFGPLVNRIIKINYADAEKLSEILKRFLSKGREGEPRGLIAVDKETNSLVVQASRDDLERIGRMVEHLDRPRAQILIEANIVEATRETARELGMRWSGRYVTSGGSLDDFGVVGEPRVPEESFLGADGASLGLVAGRIAGNVLYAHLSALQSQGKLNILSSPSITTMDNQMAYTEHGERVPYETTDEEGNREVEFQDAVLRLEVVPGIIDGEHMKMRIKVKKDEVDFTQTVNGNPLIRAKETETNLVVRDGETIVISGLSKQTVSGREQGAPGLKDLPGLGWLFKTRDRGEEMEEFLIFITPTILGKKAP